MQPEIDRYAHLDSFLHRWDPRWKLASLAVLMAAFAIGPPALGASPDWDREYSHGLLSLALSLALVQLSRIPLGFALRRTLPAGLFLLVFILIYPLGAPGEGPKVLGLGFSLAGLLTAVVISLRALAVVLIAFPMFGTSRFDITMKALRSMRVPGPFVQIAVFAYRYLYVYAGELDRMRTAMRARGFRGRSPRALKTLGNALGMLLVRSVERTQGIQAAMAARGYAGTFRTFEEFAARPGDVALAAAAVAAAGTLFYLRFRP